MSAEVETMAYAGQVPWHGFGEKLAEAATSEEMILKAGLDWKVELGPLYDHKGRVVEGRQTVYRDSDDKMLGITGGRYVPIQNAEMFSFMDGLAQDRVVRYNTAGALYGGKVVWMLAEMPTDVTIAGDTYHDYLLLTSGHDLEHSLKVLPTRVRVVCANTLKMATNAAGISVRVTHAGNVNAKLTEAAKVLDVATDEQRRYAAWLDQLATKKVSAKARGTLETALFGEADTLTTARKQEAFSTWNDILSEEDALHPGTAYALLQTVTGYADHGVKLQARKDQPGSEQMVSFLSGVGDGFKRKGIKVLVDLTGVKVPA